MASLIARWSLSPTVWQARNPGPPPGGSLWIPSRLPRDYARKARLRALVPHENAVAGLDLGEKKQALVVTGADGAGAGAPFPAGERA